MHFAHTVETEQRRVAVDSFMRSHVWPQDEAYRRAAANGEHPLALVEPLKERAKSAGWWNLCLPELRDDQPGTRLTNVEYAPLAESMGAVPWSSEVFNCSPPDSVNMHILQAFATPHQREAWLRPLLAGTIRSALAMSERDVASSDPSTLQTTIAREGDELVVNGSKWFVNGALHPNFAFVSVVGVSEHGDADSVQGRYSVVIVPKDTPGLEIGRNVSIMGQPWPNGYCEVQLRDVRVPIENLVGELGDGADVTASVSPAILHHCMRTIGQCELALRVMRERAQHRHTSRGPLAGMQNVREWIAESRIEIEQARLLTLRAAWQLDTGADAAAGTDLSAAKVAAARLQTRVVDRAIQVFGALGLTPDTPLAYLWTWGRAMRIIDGPDEIHLGQLADAELGRHSNDWRW